MSVCIPHFPNSHKPVAQTAFEVIRMLVLQLGVRQFNETSRLFQTLGGQNSRSLIFKTILYGTIVLFLRLHRPSLVYIDLRLGSFTQPDKDFLGETGIYDARLYLTLVEVVHDLFHAICTHVKFFTT